MQTRSAALALAQRRISMLCVPEDIRTEVLHFFEEYQPKRELSKSDVLRLIFAHPELDNLSHCENKVIAAVARCSEGLVSKVAAKVAADGDEALAPARQLPGRKALLSDEQIANVQSWIRQMCIAKAYPSIRDVKHQLTLELERSNPDACPTSSWYHYQLKRVLSGAFKIKTARPLEEERYEVNKDDIATYFRLLNDPRIRQSNPELFFNVDESGFGASKSGRLRACKVVVPAEMRETPTTMDRAESHYVTCIACANLAGRALMPGFITKRQFDHPDAEQCSFYGSVKRYYSPKAFVTKQIFGQYFRDVILREILRYRECHPGEEQRAVVIMDGCTAHVSDELKALCAENNVFVLILPPHSSHLIQMLDLGFFRRAKHQYAYFPSEPRISKISNTLDRVFQAYSACRVKSFIWRCWRHSGIDPVVSHGKAVGYTTVEGEILEDPALNHPVNEMARGRPVERAPWGIVNADERMIYEAGQCPFCCYPFDDKEEE